MGILIDSSVIINVERGAVDLAQVLETFGVESVAIAAITASELLHGVHRAKTPAQRSRREAFVERILKRIPVLPFDLVVSRIHARIWAELAAQSQPIGSHDLQIGATALAANFAVATHDRRSFPKIPGLRLHVW